MRRFTCYARAYTDMNAYDGNHIAAPHVRDPGHGGPNFKWGAGGDTSHITATQTLITTCVPRR